MECLESADNDDSQQIEKNNVSVTVTEDGFSEITKFSDGDFPEFIKRALEKQGYQKPTPIQSHVWPIALKGRDIVGVAQTGSGKTLAYGLPAILHICEKEHMIRNDEPTVLILAPTRELAQQINTVFNDFLGESSITNACVFGGASKESQIYNLDKGFNILIATPGRLIDFLETRRFTLKRCTFLVLDEADRMLDMGFEPQIRSILEDIPTARQTLMFSATWPDEVQSLAREFLSNYVQVNVGAMQLSANHNIKQIVEILEEGEKDEKLMELIKNIMNEQERKTIIFAATKVRVSELTNNLKNEGLAVISMHGNKSQNEREYALKQFRSGICSILVATDVAARGLDVDDIKYVINVDYPNSSEDYVHRIGRTGRSNNSGTAYTFFTFEDMKQAKELVDILTEAKQDVNPALIHLAEMSKSFKCGKGRGLGSGRYEVNESKPKKQDNYHKKGQDYRRDNYSNRGHDNYKNRDRDNSRNWDRDNRNSDCDSRNWDRDDRSWNRDSKRNWNRDSYKNEGYDNKRNWNQDGYKNEDYDKKRNWNEDRSYQKNWNRDDYKNEDHSSKRNWNQDDSESGDHDYRDSNQDSHKNYPKKPRQYEDDKKASPRQNKYQPYDSSADSSLLLSYIQ